MGTVRSNQGIGRRCRAVVPGTTSGDLLLATSTCGWDMITDWPRISILTCKLKTNFNRRQKTEGDEAHDTGLLTTRNDYKELLTRDQDKGPQNRDHYQRQDR